MNSTAMGPPPARTRGANVLLVTVSIASRRRAGGEPASVLLIMRTPEIRTIPAGESGRSIFSCLGWDMSTHGEMSEGLNILRTGQRQMLAKVTRLVAFGGFLAIPA